MGNHISAKALQVNEVSYHQCPKDVVVNCDHSRAEGTEWWIPVIEKGVHIGYARRRSSTKPTPDSVNTVRVRDYEANTTYWLVIADDADSTVYTSQCSACCGEVEPLPAVVIPAVLIEEVGCCAIPADTECLFTYCQVGRTLVGAERVYLKVTKNGVAATPAAPGAGFASLAAAVTWANTNWSAIGTFTSDGLTICYESADAETGGITLFHGIIPVANAGPDQTGVTADEVTLTGATSTAGSGTIESYAWVRTSGPNTPVITTPSGVTTTVTGLAVGTYVFTLTVTNSNGLIHTDTVSIVKSA